MTHLTVPFHGNDLILIDHQNQPYTPMKSIVEGMGLAWQSQHRKLTANIKRWGITILMIPTESGTQETLCMPLRKLFGWLSTISPNKVKPELKERITWYQNECDDVLWEYWNAQRGQSKKSSSTLSPAQQRHIQARVAYLATQPGNSYATVWRSVKDRFKVGTYKDIPASRFPELCKYLGAPVPTGLEIEGELVNEPAALIEQSIHINYPATGNKFTYSFSDMHNCGWNTNMDKFLGILEQNKGKSVTLAIEDISGIRKEFLSLQHLVEVMDGRIARMRDAALYLANQASIKGA